MFGLTVCLDSGKVIKIFWIFFFLWKPKTRAKSYYNNCFGEELFKVYVILKTLKQFSWLIIYFKATLCYSKPKQVLNLELFPEFETSIENLIHYSNNFLKKMFYFNKNHEYIAFHRIFSRFSIVWKYFWLKPINKQILIEFYLILR